MTSYGGIPKSPLHAEEVTLRRTGGDIVRAEVAVGQDQAVPASLAARLVRLEDDTELRLLEVASTTRKTGYERLDSEILAGLRLREVTDAAAYPREVSRLYDYEATSARPWALLERYRGEPLTAIWDQLMDAERQEFQVSLLTGLCWLAAAGLAHRGIGLSTVRWDGRHAQITDFSLSTVVTGVPGEETGRPGAAPEQLEDVSAAGRLIYYVSAQEEFTDGSQLADWPSLKPLETVFGPPEGRPTAAELLRKLTGSCPAPRASDESSRLNEGRSRFRDLRGHKQAAKAGAGKPAAEPDYRAAPPAEPVLAEPGPVATHEPADQPKNARRSFWRGRDR